MAADGYHGWNIISDLNKDEELKKIVDAVG